MNSGSNNKLENCPKIPTDVFARHSSMGPWSPTGRAGPNPSLLKPNLISSLIETSSSSPSATTAYHSLFLSYFSPLFCSEIKASRFRLLFGHLSFGLLATQVASRSIVMAQKSFPCVVHGASFVCTRGRVHTYIRIHVFYVCMYVLCIPPFGFWSKLNDLFVRPCTKN